jgi:2-oxo-3-hexenedioate decarboxylase
MLTAEKTAELAGRLDTALQNRHEIQRLTQEVGDLSLRDAYGVMRAGVALREARGECVIGWKMGLTSAAKREQMNLDQAIWGVLTDAMLVANAGELRVADGVHPKIEPEIALRLGQPLSGRVTRAQAWAAVDGVCAALEVLDSRYVGFKYFSLPDVVADNASSWRFVLGPWEAPCDVADLPMAMAVNEVVVQSGTSAAISGHPVESLVQLMDLLGEFDLSLPAGAIILTGAATLAEPLHPGMHVRLRIPGLADACVTAI